MSPHQIATAIDDAARAFRASRFQGAAEYLEAKDLHCRHVADLVRQLRRAIGTPEPLSLRPGRRNFGRYGVEVALRARARSAVA